MPLYDKYSRNVLNTGIVSALGLCLFKHYDGKDNEKEMNEPDCISRSGYQSPQIYGMGYF